MKRVVVVGAGIGGLSSAALLAKAGLDVTVLEAHNEPGGCASTFYHHGYRFDAGATLSAGFYLGGPMDLLAQAIGVEKWPTEPTDTAMVVHLPDGWKVFRLTGQQRWEERLSAFGTRSEKFWRWQERTADALWDLALRGIPWPPQSFQDWTQFIPKAFDELRSDLPARHLPQFILDAFRPISHHLQDAPERLRLFIDGQLLISAQTTSPYANALYATAALDLPRRGAVHLKGGMIAIAEAIVEALCKSGGQIHYQQQATNIRFEKDHPTCVETKGNGTFPADLVILNIPPWNIAPLTQNLLPNRMRGLPQRPKDGWGAFMVYVGVDASLIPEDLPLHHQVIVKEPLGEGNSLFLSLNPPWDSSRAPNGRRALTISTHTALEPWWNLHQKDKAAYEARKQAYLERVLDSSERVLPGLREASHLLLPGTPLTFQRFTRRKWGWVGGFPQTHLFRNWGPRLSPDLWMVGDSIFPGQSTAAVALGGMRVARSILRTLNLQTYPTEVTAVASPTQD
jgi:C-3',4' desaturase CrtD